ncbi:Choline-glycine betaine transporter [Halalkaliarchaeum sp. AArc-CO]|nr:Choline-glycine betaine transporter [Halalkaliarchaeum sp. AArc-CO]
MVEQFTNEVDGLTFGIGVVVASLAVAAFIFREGAATEIMWSINDLLWEQLSWFYLMIMFVFVVFVIFLILSPWGKIKLGKDGQEPEFTFLSYFVMLYSAAIAAGIVFWGPAEAIFHYETPSPLVGADGMTSEAAVGALQYTFFHWGISAWTVYIIMALPIAFYAYRHDAPLRISTVIAPWVGLDNLDGFWAKVIDVVAVLTTIGGVATTLGLVGSQFLVGLNYVAGVQVGDLGTVLVITGLTVGFTLSVAAGVRRGIRRVSHFNMVLFFVLMIAAFLLGPTSYIMTAGTEALGGYINEFITMSLYTNAEGAEPAWFVGSWTVFYWAWWFSWAPFVGLFIARISKGRTVRQVAFTGVFASTGITIPWFATMGGTSIFMQETGQADVLAVIGEYGGDEAAAGYPMFEALPLGELLTVMFLVLITTFLITSADSSTLALGMLTTGGAESPSTINRVIWAALIGMLASMLMVVGGVDAVQAAAIILGTPFGIVLFLGMLNMIVTFGGERPIFLQSEEEIPVVSARDEFTAADDD